MLVELSEAIEARDPSVRGHSDRVTELAEAVALELCWDEERLVTVRLGGLLHDVGKLGVSMHVLLKPGSLTDAELAEVRTHPATGARLIAPFHEARAALPCVLFHHERWDGAGYPSGRAGEQIPVEARLLAIADAFDAMTSDRPYRRALAWQRALAELERCAGTQFDPELVAAFVDVWQREPSRRRELSASARR